MGGLVMVVVVPSFRSKFGAVRGRTGRRSLTRRGWGRGSLGAVALLLSDSEIHVELDHSFLRVSLVFPEYACSGLQPVCRV